VRREGEDSAKDPHADYSVQELLKMESYHSTDIYYEKESTADFYN
jgi:hypothetical protein